MTYEQNYLAHFGIKGMKWGIRRFQNEDGTLTNAGKQRYGEDHSDSKSWKKSDAKKLSDDELRRRNNRLQAERQYRDLTTSDAERDRRQMKNDIKRDILRKALILPVVGIAAYVATKAIKNNGTKMVDMIEHFGKKKVASLKASSMLKKAVKGSKNMYEYNPLKDYAFSKHPEWKGLDLRRRD